MQVDPVPPIIFNIVVDSVVMEVLGGVCGPQEAQNGLVLAAGGSNVIFFTDYGRLAGRDHK